MTVVALDEQAHDRLGDLGLSVDVIERAVLRADAEAKLSTDLEPPTAEGITRYNKTNGYLREALVPSGWDYDNAQNFCRTIHPSRAFSIVASSGDAATGVWVPGQNPSTKYKKGETTVRAVEANGQPALDLGEEFELVDPQDIPESVWYLLYRVEPEQIFVELSFPSEIVGGRIANWTERIILEPIRRNPEPNLTQDVDQRVSDEYTVDVEMR